MNSTTPLVDAAVDDTAFEDKNQPHTDWITAHAGREIEEKMNEARRELAHARDMLTVANETSAAADRIRIGLERELNESHAREAQLRAALEYIRDVLQTEINIGNYDDEDVRRINDESIDAGRKAEQALSTFTAKHKL
jgi:hypothetical protein